MFISRFFQVAVLALLVSHLMVACRSSDHKESEYEVDTLQGVTSGTVQKPFKRRYKFIHKCSGKFLQIMGKSVKTANLKFDELLVQTLDFGSKISIQGNKSKTYLCFTKHGKLMARARFVPKYCTFRETMAENHYTELQINVTGQIWRVGFNKRGRPLPGELKNKGNCYQFIKDSLDGPVKSGQTSNAKQLDTPKENQINLTADAVPKPRR